MRPPVSVLCVDDDADICEVLRTTLFCMAGLEVCTARSGEQAIRLAAALHPDLILMDVTMPGLDGPATLKRMRDHGPLRDTPVIFLTAKVFPAEISRFLGLGALGVICKPFDPMRLCDEVFRLWNRAAVREDPVIAHAARAQIAAHVGSLTDQFLERTRLDVARLRTILGRPRHEDRSSMDEVARTAHSMHGAGAMFGFPELSATSGAIESLVEGIMSDSPLAGFSLSTAMLKSLHDLVDQLARTAISGVSPASCNGILTGLPRPLQP
jgi:CheY-like chemotaxis protein